MIFNRHRAKREIRAAPLGGGLDGLARRFVPAGMGVPSMYQPDVALELPAVAAALQLLTTEISGLPVVVEQRDGDRWSPVEDGAARVLLDAWEPGIESSTALRMMVHSLVLHGFAAAWIDRRPGGEAAQIVVLPPRRVTRTNISGRVRYEYLDGGLDLTSIPRFLPDEDLIWIETLRPLDRSSRPRSLLEASWSAIAGGIAAQRWGQWYFERGATANLFFIAPAENPPQVSLTNKQLWKLFDSMREHGRRESSLPHGWQVVETGSPPDAAQLDKRILESVHAVARIVSVPPLLLQDLSNSTYTNYPSGLRFFARFTVRAMVRMIESEITYKMWSDGRRRYRFDLSDTGEESRLEVAQRLQTEISAGIISQNEGRHVLGMDPKGDPADPENPANQLIRSQTVPATQVMFAGLDDEEDDRPDEPDGDDDGEDENEDDG